MLTNFIAEIAYAASSASDIPYESPLWADPRVWLIGAVIIIVLTIILIYFKVFSGETGP